MVRPKIYVSGPVTQGNRNENYHRAMEMHRVLMLNGFAPFSPIASTCFPFAWQDDMPHDLWLQCDLPWVESADGVYRLPGPSAGADIEVAHAIIHDVPVFYGLDSLYRWRDENDG